MQTANCLFFTAGLTIVGAGIVATLWSQRASLSKRQSAIRNGLDRYRRLLEKGEIKEADALLDSLSRRHLDAFAS